MKVIRCKLQQQTAKPINDNQKDYYFACPLKDVDVGWYYVKKKYQSN